MTDQHDENILHVAVRHHQLDILKWALQKRVSVNAQNLMGDTPLLVAIQNHDSTAAQLLLIMGASPLIANDYGNNIFHFSLFFRMGNACMHSITP